MSAQLLIFTFSIGFLIYKRFILKNENEILLIVFGEFERSPRMKNHKNCFIEKDFKVNVIAYEDVSVLY